MIFPENPVTLDLIARDNQRTGSIVKIRRYSALAMVAALSFAGLASSQSATANASNGLGSCTVLNYTVHEVCFNDPAGTTSEQNVLIQRLTNYANAAGSGDTVRIAMYRWNVSDSLISPFTTALDNAQTRGADVQILIDSGAGSSNISSLKSTFGASNVQSCGPNDCLVDGADQHNKLFLFTINGVNTTVVSSINLTNAIADKYSNMVILHDELLSFYSHYFDRMWADDWDGWTTTAKRVHAGVSGRIQGYVYPQSTDHDTVADILNSVTDCNSGANSVWLLANEFTPGRLTRASNRLIDAFDGVPSACDVRVILEDIPSDPADPTVISKLKAAGVSVRLYQSTPLHHSKYILVHAKTTALIGSEGTSWHNYVWTGSTNMGEGPFDGANSNVLMLDSTALAKYSDQFSYLWSQSVPA